MPEHYGAFTKGINEYGGQSAVRWGNQSGGPLEISALHSRVRDSSSSRKIFSTRTARETILICYYDTVANEKNKTKIMHYWIK